MPPKLLIAILAVLALLAPPAPLSAVTVSRVTCATTATLAYTAATGGSTVLLRNAGAASVFLGPAAVTTATGWELVTGAGLSVPLGPGDTLYCIVASGTNRVDAMEARR